MRRSGSRPSLARTFSRGTEVNRSTRGLPTTARLSAGSPYSRAFRSPHKTVPATTTLERIRSVSLATFGPSPCHRLTTRRSPGGSTAVKRPWVKKVAPPAAQGGGRVRSSSEYGQFVTCLQAHRLRRLVQSIQCHSTASTPSRDSGGEVPRTTSTAFPSSSGHPCITACGREGSTRSSTLQTPRHKRCTAFLTVPINTGKVCRASRALPVADQLLKDPMSGRCQAQVSPPHLG